MSMNEYDYDMYEHKHAQHQNQLINQSINDGNDQKAYETDDTL